jgi:hypothetical protein
VDTVNNQSKFILNCIISRVLSPHSEHFYNWTLEPKWKCGTVMETDPRFVAGQKIIF